MPRAAIVILRILVVFPEQLDKRVLAVVDRVFITITFHSGVTFASVSRKGSEE